MSSQRSQLAILLSGLWAASLAMLLSMTGEVPSASATMSCDYSGGCGGGGSCSNTTCSPGGGSCYYYAGTNCSLSAQGTCWIDRC
jgi:hypothetical protein